MLLMWYEEVFPLSNTTFAALFADGIILGKEERDVDKMNQTEQKNDARVHKHHQWQACAPVVPTTWVFYDKWCISNYE